MTVVLVPHDPGWAAAFEREAEAILQAHGSSLLSLHHIGSTSIPGILAKPVIDMLGEAASLAGVDRRASNMIGLGYEPLGEFGIVDRRYFRKIDAHGVRTHHVHVFPTGSLHIERHLAFRDFLIAHPDRASDYAELKCALAAGADTSWDAYGDGKAPFIDEAEAEAVQWYRRTR